MRTYEVTNEDMELIKKAYATLDKAKVEGNYYHTVGSCVRTKDGRTFEGVNCDCIHGSCAEFITIGKAISEGCHEFDTIVAVHPEGPAGLFAPCGNCRHGKVNLILCCGTMARSGPISASCGTI